VSRLHNGRGNSRAVNGLRTHFAPCNVIATHQHKGDFKEW
jgi:hypothetical protein